MLLKRNTLLKAKTGGSGAGNRRSVAPRAKPSDNGASAPEKISEFQREYLPKLLDEQQDAAKSGNEINQLMRWASDLGSKAQQALSGLQRSIQSFPETTADAAAPAQNGTTPATTAEADIAATISKLEGVSAAIRDSNTAFETAFPSADGGAAAAVVAEAAEGVEDRVKERQEYLQGLVGDMEAAEEALVKEAAAKQEAATEALAAAASVVAAAASEAAAEVEEAVEEAVAGAEEAVAGAEAVVAAAEPAKASGEGVEVEIAVRCETQPGQDVWVVGSIPALGSWDLDGALALAWTEGHVWRATITVDPAAAAHIEYKAVLKCSDAPTVWEGGDNKGGDVEAGGAKVELYHEFTY